MKHPIHHILFKRSLIFAMMSTILWASSCQEPEPFSTTPTISFKNLKFVQTQANNTLDSLVLEFDFEDGDGDLGLSNEDVSPPYHDVEYIVDSNDNPVTLNGVHPTPFFSFTPVNGGTLNTTGRTLGDFEFFSDTDIRPTYSCLDYDTISFGDNPIDTLFIVKNEFRFNLYLKFFWDRGEGFEELDFEFLTSQFGCGENFNGRFPILDESNIGTSLQGSIKYSMVSAGFEITLRDNPFKIQFFIYDRATNKSNIVETPVFTLDKITILQ